jgi:hypothetical protein
VRLPVSPPVRPAAATLRSQLDDGRLIFRLERRWRDGTAAFVLEAEKFVARPAAPVPPEAGCPGGAPAAPTPWGAAPAAPGADCAAPRSPRARRPYRWAKLMRRAFAVDVLECPRSYGPMKILAAIHPPDTAGVMGKGNCPRFSNCSA